jgi:hypothetical protein
MANRKVFKCFDGVDALGIYNLLRKAAPRCKLRSPSVKARYQVRNGSRMSRIAMKIGLQLD